MQELIKVTKREGGIPAVSARELWQFLESKQDFTTWIKARIKKYGFTENIDYTLLHKKMEQVSGTKHLLEYYISLDMAKELSMVENNAKGRQARKYFIAMEKKAKQPAKLTSQELIATALIEADKVLKEKDAKILELKPKAELADQVIRNKTKEFSITDAGKQLGVRKTVMFNLLRKKKTNNNKEPSFSKSP